MIKKEIKEGKEDESRKEKKGKTKDEKKKKKVTGEQEKYRKKKKMFAMMNEVERRNECCSDSVWKDVHDCS